ncbi:MAG: hopanoid biosynthesis-associated protein HpnK [Syntrophobacteraceae bacterium]|nr:hopanoid biosynthesis-associated protein HpnK [Syntrophobacteraceae bacterium]
MKQRRLIINGDDFGLCREVNEAVILAWRKGVLTSTSLMASGEAFDQAVALAKENPGLAVGLHVTCVAGRAVLPPFRIPHVVGNSGQFPGDPALAGLKYFFRPGARKDLLSEIGAQFEKFARSGLNFSHVDSHCHMHVNPAVLGAIVQIAESYGIKRIRVPADSFFAALPFARSSVGTSGHALMFSLLTRRMKRILGKRGFIFPRTVYGNLLTGNVSLEYVLSVLDRLPHGTSELYFHPALPCGPPGDADRQLLQRFRELAILLHPDVRSTIDRLGVRLSTYSDLETNS